MSVNLYSGILLHPTSLPGPYGIGEIGFEAYKFVDDLADMGQSLWQILPLNPTDIYNSPYSSLSTFAGNHLLISLDLLVEDNLLERKLIPEINNLDPNIVDFDEVISVKTELLAIVAENFHEKISSAKKDEYHEFCLLNEFWLSDFSRYWSIKRQKIDLDKNFFEKDAGRLSYTEECKIIQFIFNDQWMRLRKYCNSKGVKIIGDMPIYIGEKSCDVLSNPSLFELDRYGKMLFQSGCPPCEYNLDGQLWGTPTYRWRSHKETDYNWWIKRFNKLFEMVDIIRLDHFIGYLRYYRIPVGDTTAENGEWIDAPGHDLFINLKSRVNNLNVIVEDLGDITDEVLDLRDKFQFPGMNVLQFEMESVASLPDFPHNSLVCSGTHDNDTIKGWFKSMPHKNRKQILNVLNCLEKDINWGLINYALSTSSKFVVTPIQDLLGKSSASRFNIPGRVSKSNWSWRMSKHDLSSDIKEKMYKLTKDNNRK